MSATVSRPAAPSAPLTELSGRELAAAIRSGRVTSREVVGAHVERLREVGPRLNPIAAPRFEDALAEAEAADARVASASEGEDLPPYLGVPCTIKEAIAVEGMPNCTGLDARRHHRATETAPVAERLLASGAILLGVTNTSELCMWPETGNRVYGRTHNPYDPRRTAGGSSGGEGAAIGSGGAPIGLGSDVGGSIRIPAFFCGIFGHKPSPGLVPNALSYPEPDGSAAERLLCHRADGAARRGPDADAAHRLGPRPARRLRARDAARRPRGVRPRRPRRADRRGDLLRASSRELRDSIERAAEALESAGARPRRVPIRAMRRAYALYVTALNDGESSIAKMLADEGCEPLTMRTIFSRRGPHTAPIKMLAALERLAALQPDGLTRRALAAGHAFAREVVDTIGDGVLLHPPHPRAAPRHHGILLRPFSITPVVLFNLAGTPVTQVPLGLGDRGLPLGVQVVAGPGRDHVSIAVALELERALGGWVPPS